MNNINETRNYFIEEINQNELISKKQKKLYEFKLYQTLTYFSFCG